MPVNRTSKQVNRWFTQCCLTIPTLHSPRSLTCAHRRMTLLQRPSQMKPRGPCWIDLKQNVPAQKVSVWVCLVEMRTSYQASLPPLPCSRLRCFGSCQMNCKLHSCPLLCRPFQCCTDSILLPVLSRKKCSRYLTLHLHLSNYLI